MRWGFGNALRFWIDASGGKKAEEPESSVKELDARRLSIVGVFVFPLLA